MSGQLLEKLEAKIDNAIEIIELLQMQVEELEEKNSALQADNHALKTRHQHWEQSLSTLLRKFETATFNADKTTSSSVLQEEDSLVEEMV